MERDSIHPEEAILRLISKIQIISLKRRIEENRLPTSASFSSSCSTGCSFICSSVAASRVCLSYLNKEKFLTD